VRQIEPKEKSTAIDKNNAAKNMDKIISSRQGLELLIKLLEKQQE